MGTAHLTHGCFGCLATKKNPTPLRQRLDRINMFKDKFHEAVKQALQKEGWTITDDPLRFQYGNVNFQVDLALERIVAAEREGEKNSS